MFVFKSRIIKTFIYYKSLTIIFYLFVCISQPRIVKIFIYNKSLTVIFIFYAFAAVNFVTVFSTRDIKTDYLLYLCCLKKHYIVFEWQTKLNKLGLMLLCLKCKVSF